MIVNKKKRLNHSKKEAFNIVLILDSIRSLNSIKPIHPSLPRSRIFPCAVLPQKLSRAFLELISSFSSPKGRSVSFLSIALKARGATVCFLQSAAP